MENYDDMPVLSPQIHKEDTKEEEEELCWLTPRKPGQIYQIQTGGGKWRRKLNRNENTAKQRKILFSIQQDELPQKDEEEKKAQAGPSSPEEEIEPLEEEEQHPESSTEKGVAATASSPISQQNGLNNKNFEGPGWECISIAAAGTGRYYKAIRILGQFLLHNILVEELEYNYPEERLRAIFKRLIDWLTMECAAKGYNPQHFLVRFDSELMEKQANLHIHALNADICDVILHKFAAVDQSGMLKLKKDSLTTQSFTIDITAMELRQTDGNSAEIGKKKRKRHAGAGRKRLTYIFRYNISLDAILLLEDCENDNYCLFRSFELLRNKAILEPCQFYNYKRNKARQNKDIHLLLSCCQIPKNMDSYEIEEWGDKIATYYRQVHGNKFRLFSFAEFGDFKPFWASSENNDNGYEKELCLLYSEGNPGHYEPIIYPGHLFGDANKQYCFACLVPYHSQFEHNWNCAFKCRDCSRVGPTFPCKPDADGGTEINCADCKKIFRSEDCFNFHLKKIGNAKPLCQRHHRCEKCGDKYVVKVQKRDGRKGHICGERYCRNCQGYHRPRPCYIRRFEEIDYGERRFVIHDAECTTDFQPDPNILRFQHIVNFISAHVFCTLCLREGTWDKPLNKECPICGPHRFYTWNCSDYNKTKVDVKFITPKPLVDFTHWLLTNWKKDKKGGKKRTRARKQNARQGERGGTKRARQAVNPFIDDEAEDDRNYDSSEEQDILQLLGHNFPYEDATDDDEEEEEADDDGRAGTPNSFSGFLERLDDDDDAGNNVEEDGYNGNRKKKREVATYAYAHYGSKYDNVLIQGEILRRGYCPKVIKQGGKLFQVEIRKRGRITPTYLRDTYNLIPIKLDRFVETFNLDIPGLSGKQFFPYKFNKNENLGTVLDHLPSRDDYCANGMMKKHRAKFEAWYSANENTQFELREVLADYCCSDVKLLAHGFVKMREIFWKATEMDISKSITASGACMKYFRSTLPPDFLALTPQLGYEHYGKQSAIARKYLKWLEHEHGVPIQTIESDAGEKRFKKWFLDGYIERSEPEGGPIAIEINGCFWHACRRCNPGLREEHFLGRKNVGKIWEEHRVRTMEIRSQMHLWIIWECEIHAELEQNPEMREFFDTLEDTGPIILRDAFMGGRTGPEWLYAEAPSENPTENMVPQQQLQNSQNKHRTIKVKDFKSLYPFVNFSTSYPVAHPQLRKFDQKVNWTSGDDLPSDAHILKVFVVPPRKCAIPVLPNRFGKDGRLLFGLCRKCISIYKNGGIYDPEYSCDHVNDEERGYVGTYTSIELKMALDSGYRVTRFYRAYCWPDPETGFSDELFKQYIKSIMRLKYIAEGWPPSCVDPALSEGERLFRKEQYILDARLRYGIEFTIDEMQNNPGLKYVAKLLLNSLWGRFALRNLLSTTVFANNDMEIAKYLNDSRYDIQELEQISQRTWMIVYRPKEEQLREHDCSNIIVALWTTAAARVLLLKVMQKLLQRPDVRLLYYDTDSVFYQYDTDLGDPIEDGKHLGEMTDQYPDHKILEYLCLAPKLYSLKLEHKNSGEISYETKAKGLTLDCTNAERLNHDTMKISLMNYIRGDNVEPIECFYPDKNFRTTNKGQIYTIPLVKKVKPVANKGMVIGGGRLVPFGWSPNSP